MKKSRQVIKILEGFKLGDLGARKKRLAPEEIVYDTPQNMGIQITRKSWVDSTKVKTNDWITGVQWTESTVPAMKFFMRCDAGLNGYDVRIMAGCQLAVQFRSGALSRDIDFLGRFEFRTQSDEDAEKYIKIVFEKILVAGNFGFALATGKLGQVRFRNVQSFKDYLYRTTKVISSPYVKLT
jgi:hypothetical protein